MDVDILKLLDGGRHRIDVLAHPFYRRWNAGKLSGEELALYAGQYRHAVGALADVSALAAEKAQPPHRDGLLRHAAEERRHEALWDDFAAAVGAGGPVGRERPLAETAECVRSWTAGEDLLDHLAALYAVEASQPAISESKIAGLAEHYGFERRDPALAYFHVHRTLDVEHARDAGKLLQMLAEPADGRRLLARAEDALRGNWRLLDGVQEHAASVTPAV